MIVQMSVVLGRSGFVSPAPVVARPGPALVADRQTGQATTRTAGGSVCPTNLRSSVRPSGTLRQISRPSLFLVVRPAKVRVMCRCHPPHPAPCTCLARTPAWLACSTPRPPGSESDSVVVGASRIGITPLMAKFRDLTDLSWPGDIDLMFSVKTERDVIFREELDALRRRDRPAAGRRRPAGGSQTIRHSSR